MKEKLLLICPDFYNYYKYLENAFNKYFQTTCVPVNYSDNNFRKKPSSIFSLNFLKSKVDRNNRRKYLINTETTLSMMFFDKVLIISIFPFSNELLSNLIKTNPNVTINIFLWDELSKIPQIKSIFYLATNIFTFNAPDVIALQRESGCYRTNCLYLPNFYIERRINFDNDNSHKLTYIGTVNPDTIERLEFIGQLYNWCKQHSIDCMFYLRYHTSLINSSIIKKFYLNIFHNPFYSYIKLISKHLDKPYLHNRILPLQKVLEIESNSECLLDISHTGRHGYGLNVISAIGNNQKLISDNKFLKEEPFYSSENICVIDEKLNGLSSEFFSLKKRQIDISCLEVCNWVRMLFEPEYYHTNISKVYTKK